MKFYIGTVLSNVDSSESGEFKVGFPQFKDGEEQRVTYTSPFCKPNAGGLISIPEIGDEVLAIYNENPAPGESNWYYQSSVVKSSIVPKGTKTNKNIKPLRSNDSKAQIYGENNKPVTQTFTNIAGAGIYIQREFTSSRISNNVTMRSEGGEEVNVGPLGIQIRNADGDSIVLNGSEPNDAYGARTMSIETNGSQEYKCLYGDMNFRIVDGGDINIENNSFGDMSLGKWFGNIRLKSRYRNIDLAAVGSESYVNIFTQGATIQVDSEGTVKIFGEGNIQLESPQNISLNAGGNLNMYGRGGVQVGSGGSININGTSIAHNSIPLQYSAGAPGSDYTNSTPVVPAPGSPPPGTQFVPNDYLDPTGAQ
jgi:hypothetical protein